MSFHEESTIEWYLDWLKENRPDLADDVRLELATGFATQQSPVQKVNSADEDDELPAEQKSERAEQRKRARLTAAELQKIIRAKL